MEEAKKEQENEEESKFLSRYDTVLSFLGLELVALTLFGLGGATGITIFEILGFFLSLVTLSYFKAIYRPSARKSFFLSLIPFFVLVLLLGFSRFFLSSYSSLFAGIINSLAVSLGLLGFLFLGLSLQGIPILKKDVILLSVGGALSFLVLLTGVYSLARYGFFYAARYSGMVYYYDGVIFPIATETKILMGFSFAEASLKFGKVPAVLLSSFLAGTFFYSPKKEKKQFWVSLAFGLLGLLDLVFVPYKRGLILVAFVLLLALIYSLVRHGEDKHPDSKAGEKTFTVLFYILLGLVCLGILVLFLDSRMNFLSKIGISRIALSRKSGTLGDLASAISAVFVQENPEGSALNLKGILFGLSYSEANAGYLTPVFEFNVLWQNGLIAFALLVYFLFFMIKRSHLFLKEGKEPLGYKGIVATMLLMLFLYHSLFADEMPLAHATGYLAFSRSSWILFACFLCGLILKPNTEKEGTHEA